MYEIIRKSDALALSLPLEGMPAPVDGLEILDPSTLAPLAEDAIRALASEGESANTLRSYAGALRYWAAWYALRYRTPVSLPVPSPVVLQFIVDHVERNTEDGELSTTMPPELDAMLVKARVKSRVGPLSLATLTHRLSVLSKVHQLKGMENPVQAAAVRELMAKVRRVHARRGHTPQRKPALTREPLQALLATCDGSLRGLRDRALLLFAWSSGGRRRSEVTQARMEDLMPTGIDTYVYRLRLSKTNQEGHDRPENDKPVIGLAGQALGAWLRASGITTGVIFRRVRRGEHLGEPLTPAAVRDIVVARCRLAGIEEQGYSAHSLRSGFVTEAGRQNVPLADTMTMTGHRSVASLARYQRTDPARNIAAELLKPQDVESQETPH